MTAHALFWDRIAEKYATDPIRDETSYEEGLARVRHWLRPEMDVLEMGCGTGSTALKLADSVMRYKGTDLSKEMVRIANDKVSGVDKLSFRTAGAEEVTGQWDAVLCFNLLHLVSDPALVTRKVRATLPKGGLFISKTPCLAGKPWFGPLIWGMQVIGKAPKPVHMLSPKKLEAILRGAGFEIVESGGYPKKLPNHLIVARAI